MCSCDLEIPKVSSCVFRKARKVHKCNECDRDIAIGEEYRIDSGFIDRWYSSKTCADCQAISWRVDTLTDDFCWALGELHYTLLECEIVDWFEDSGSYCDLPDGLIVINGVLRPEPWLKIAHEIFRDRQRRQVESTWVGRAFVVNQLLSLDPFFEVGGFQ